MEMRKGGRLGGILPQLYPKTADQELGVLFCFK